MEKTRIYGLIGYPVKHSYSPSMHNAAFKALNIKAEYRLFEVRPEELEAFIRAFGENYSGANVTIPYKEKVIKYLDEIGERAKLVEAVNTIVVRGGRLIGDNTDGRGFLKAFRLNTGMGPEGKKVFMFGAGGAAKSVGFEMALSGATSFTICDLLEDRAGALALRISENTRCRAQAISPKNKSSMCKELSVSDILINATPCGMKEGDPRLVDPSLLHKGMVVCDLIYNPAKTRLIIDAIEKGLGVMNGIGMLLHQGTLAFEMWTGREPPLDVMKKALEDRIK